MCTNKHKILICFEKQDMQCVLIIMIVCSLCTLFSNSKQKSSDGGHKKQQQRGHGDHSGWSTAISIQRGRCHS